MGQSSLIRSYALIVVERPEELVESVTKACADGFQPIGGIALVREPANPAKGQPVGITRYAQAMIRLHQRGDHLIVNGR